MFSFFSKRVKQRTHINSHSFKLRRFDTSRIVLYPADTGATYLIRRKDLHRQMGQCNRDYGDGLFCKVKCDMWPPIDLSG